DAVRVDRLRLALKGKGMGSGDRRVNVRRAYPNPHVATRLGGWFLYLLGTDLPLAFLGKFAGAARLALAGCLHCRFSSPRSDKRKFVLCLDRARGSFRCKSLAAIRNRNARACHCHRAWTTAWRCHSRFARWRTKPDHSHLSLLAR